MREMICEWLCDTYNTKEHSLQLFVLCLLPALLWLYFSPSLDAFFFVLRVRIIHNGQIILKSAILPVH